MIKPSSPSTLVAATRALVLLNVLSSGRGYFDTLAMEPLFTSITAYPELITSIIVSTCPAQCILMLFIILFPLLTNIIVFTFITLLLWQGMTCLYGPWWCIRLIRYNKCQSTCF
jgi:hypothetical protein